MKILVTGGTGFVGRALCLRLARHELTVLSRDPDRARHILGAGVIVAPIDSDLGALVEQSDAVINLAGSPIADRRWTSSNRERIRASRVEITNRLVAAIARASKRPRVLISGSATGFYGADRPDERLTEDSPSGTDFLADVCREWESAAMKAAELGVRVVCLRTGIVLGPHGGALGKIAPLFRWRLGGRLGAGDQIMSWIHLDDLISSIDVALTDERMSGAINLCSPNPVSNRVFTKALAGAMGVSAFLPVPKFALRAVLGARAIMLVGSAEVLPKRLRALGARFQFPTIDEALADIFATDDIAFSAAGALPTTTYLGERGARYKLEAQTTIDADISEVFDFFSQAENLGAITPPEMGFEITNKPPEIDEGTLIDYRIRLGPAPMSWRTRIDVWDPLRRFVDAQLRGPYKSWWHEHRFDTGDESVTMTDRVYYSPPLGFLGRIAHWLFVRRKLEQIFGYRRFAIRWRFGTSMPATAAAS